ncbi:MAG TPA: hypothetical protein PLU11_08865 [Chitinophagaceae bacterium]|nr:hypothetical protein [Chitinophagaceae bacterium]HPH32093.1 hypothetical protein [Chitinophagaceae bacterium]HPN59271.1 hypothetical protein [Chitinophagaceae bacterium]
MYTYYRLFLNWSEVWPLIIALLIFVFFKQRENITIIFWLLVISLLLHTVATYISLFTYRVPEPYKNNNILYNLLAIIKPVMAGLYLLKLKQLQQYKYLKIVFLLFLLFTLFNFLFIESIFTYSSSMVLAQSAFLLIFTLTFFLDAMIDDEIPLPLSHPAYFICTAIGLSESINFFINLFIFQVFKTSYELSVLTMNISSYAFIIYGLILATGIFLNREKPRFSPFSQSI